MRNRRRNAPAPASPGRRRTARSGPAGSDGGRQGVDGSPAGLDPTAPRGGKMSDPVLCQVCGDELPDHDFPGVTTCREWADATAARLGDLLDEDTSRDLM